MSNTQIIMLALAVGGLTVLMISTYRRTRERRFQPRLSARERYAEREKEAKATRDVEQVMLELDQLARQIHGRIDTRYAKLEAVIRDADERIDKLSRLVRGAKGDTTIDVTLDAEDPREPATSPNGDAESRHAAVYKLADGGLSAAEIGQEVGKTTGEIELILALRKARTEAAQSAAFAAASGQH